VSAAERTRLVRMQALLQVLSTPDPPPSPEARDEAWMDRYAADDVLAGMLSSAIHHGRHSPGDVRSAQAESRRAGSRLSREELEEAYRLLAER